MKELFREEDSSLRKKELWSRSKLLSFGSDLVLADRKFRSPESMSGISFSHLDIR